MLNVRFTKLRKPGIVRNEKGFTLIEVVISIMLLGLIAAALATGLSTASKVLVQNDSRQTAKNLAEFQMEYVKVNDFQSGSGTVVYAPEEMPAQFQQAGYSAVIDVTDGLDLNPPRDSAFQQVTVTIKRSGVVVYTLVDYKVR